MPMKAVLQLQILIGQPETGQLRVRCGTHAGTVRLAHVIRACYPNRRASPLLLTSICVWLPSSAVASARISAQNGSFGAMLNTGRSEEHTSELQSLMRISYADVRLKKKRTQYEQKQ